LSDQKSLGQSRGEIVIVLSAAGHLIALLHEIQMCAAGIRGSKKHEAEPLGRGFDTVRLHVRDGLKRDVVVGNAYVGIIGLAGWSALIVTGAAGLRIAACGCAFASGFAAE